MTKIYPIYTIKITRPALSELISRIIMDIDPVDLQYVTAGTLASEISEAILNYEGEAKCSG